MPGEVKALYLNSESVAQAAEYVEVADSCGINAFVWTSWTAEPSPTPRR